MSNHLFLLTTLSLLLLHEGICADDDDKEKKARDERRSERDTRREDRKSDNDTEFKRPQKPEKNPVPSQESRTRDRSDESRRGRDQQYPERNGSRKDDIGPPNLPQNPNIERERPRGDNSRWEDKNRTDVRKYDQRITKDRLKQREDSWNQRGKSMRRQFADYRRRDHIFDENFWRGFRHYHHNWHFDNHFNWSVDVSWPKLTVWLPYKWSRPVYYYYGSNGGIYYSQNSDFTYLVPVDSTQRFISEAVRIANRRQPLSRNQSEWMPLGMYALSYDTGGSERPNEFISLAMSNDGAISGAYFNTKTKETREIMGSIDPTSQRVAWKFVGQDLPVMESGLYNLTKDESTILIHTGYNYTEPRMIVRLN